MKRSQPEVSPLSSLFRAQPLSHSALLGCEVVAFCFSYLKCERFSYLTASRAALHPRPPLPLTPAYPISF